MLRLFIHHAYTQNFLHFNSSFSPLALTPLHTHTHTHTPLHIVLRVIPYQIYTDQKRYNLLSIFRQQLPNSNIVSYLILTCMSWLQPKKGVLHLISNNNNNYDLGVKVRCCGFVDFVNDVTDYECLECVFYFRIKEREKRILYQFSFYNIPPKLFFFFFFLITLIK